jgi:hypothetical protein
MKSNYSRLAMQSCQLLRGKAHALLEEKFPEKKKRYRWLKRNSPKMHMSQMNREQLKTLISKLETL